MCQPEICNAKDDDCDGLIDETCPLKPVAAGGSGNIVSYLANTCQLEAIHALSDGSFVAAGGANSLDWIPAGVPRVELARGGASINSKATGRYAFLIHLSKDLKQLLSVVHLPKDTLSTLSRIRSSEVPGAPTRGLYISGPRTVSAPKEDGYTIIKLDGNFVTSTPTGIEWSFDVRATPRQSAGYTGTSAFKVIQPWDVAHDGSVIFGEGAEFDYEWASIRKLSPQGQKTTVEHWPMHNGTTTECRYQAASTCTNDPISSSIVLKLGREGTLRSLSQADFDLLQVDGNGMMERKGKWPEDYFFKGPCLLQTDQSYLCASGGGYTGYKPSDRPTARLGSIIIDRRNGHLYYGYSYRNVRVGNVGDYDPIVVAMNKAGKLKWWSRLYHERTKQPDGSFQSNPTPAQYVDGLAIDYQHDQLVVLARSHGNNTTNFWPGNQIAANPGANGFQNTFTGSKGVHVSWLGKLTLAAGTLQHATYVAEFAEGATFNGSISSGPLKGWPNPNAGWPDLNTTECRNELQVDHMGQVYVLCKGRRVLTTNHAYQQMPKPAEGLSGWSFFARVYAANLSSIVYSTILRDTWDPKQDGGDYNLALRALIPLQEGLLAVGNHLVDEQSQQPKGQAIPTANVPSWGASQPKLETGVVAHFKYPAP